jgi:thiol-disulfide isomerase/thioredoxin
MQSFGRLLIVVILSTLSGWYLFHQTLEKKGGNQTTSVKVSSKPLANLSFPDINAQPQALKQWQGKVLVLNFWATWCPPCREEMPELTAMQQQYKNQNLMIIGLSTDDLEQTKKFIKTAPVSYPILAGDTAAMNLAETLGNDRGILPYTVIVDANGAVVKTFFGRVNQQLLEKTIIPLLNLSAAK